MGSLSKLLAKSSEFSVSQSSTCFEDINVDVVVDSLKKDGFYLGMNLPEEIIQEIVLFAHSQPCYGYRQPHLGFYYHQKELAQSYYGTEFTLAGYFNTALHCPVINQLQSDPKLLAIAAQYLEHEPCHQGNQLWWSFAGESSEQHKRKAFQMFHYDIDDYRFLKFFFYLTDVDVYGGPHICVRGSHKQKKISHLLLPKREKDEEIINYYGEKLLVSIYGKAGFGFAEDTFCFHKGTTPIKRDRLILQIEFGTTDYGMQHDMRESSLLQCMNNPKSSTVSAKA
ncbi:hypothetical protein NIES22_61350 [Calothrix brevissima NIES-22]|nr:hypothetical protein NIES22_61350 [Calothrix brevissima NIES-22]